MTAGDPSRPIDPRARIGALCLAAALAAALASAAATPAAETTVSADPPLAIVDHHVHLLGPDLLRDWKAMGVPFSRPDDAYLSAARLLAPGADHAPPVLAAAILVPMAHFYGNGELRAAVGLSLTEERERVARENDHVAREAARYPGRAVAYCAVDPLRPYAWEELRRCRAELASPGIKIHLGSARADLTDDAQLAELARIAGWAEAEEIALLLHFDPQRRGLEVADVERFLARVLAPYPRLELQIAHLGGSGGYGAWTRAVFRAFRDWLAAAEARGEPRPGVRFELSAAILEQESEGVAATTPEESAALAADLETVDPERLLFGSDAPVFDPTRYAALLGERLGWSRAELERHVSRRAPSLGGAAASPTSP
jgi:predicted TIM-barrel fold metal-dependent hydrolase